jgi:hypothetical protein
LAIGAAPSFPQCLLACFTLGILLSFKCLVQMAFPHCPTQRWMDVIAGLMAFLLASLLGVDALDNGGVPFNLHSLIFVLPTLGLGATFVAAHRWMALLPTRGRQLSSQPVAWLAVALSFAAAAWSSHRYTADKLKIEVEKARFFAGDGEVEAVGEFVAVTDRGRELKLRRWKPKEGSRIAAHLQALVDSTSANCHGWVFTAGKYFLECDDVEKILEDNGYELCQSPLPGDLIVYRNPAGGISHTGLIQTVYLGGMVVIDSKWGLGGRFIHGPEQQPYGNCYGYYRSFRQGHALAIIPARPAMSIASR